MAKKITLACHDACGEVKIVDKYEELDIEGLKYCPFCGGQNIEVTEDE